MLGLAGLGLSSLAPASALAAEAGSSAPEAAAASSAPESAGPELVTEPQLIDPEGERNLARIDGQVYEVMEGRASVQLRAGREYQDGMVVFVYRYYDQIPDVRGQAPISGETFIGRTMLQQVNGTSAVLVAPLLELRPGDRLRLVSDVVASTVSNSAWVPRGKARRSVQEPFLVPRYYNNRIQFTLDAAQMGKKTSDNGVPDYYGGGTVDFTYWPMLFDTPYEKVEYIRFGAGVFKGETPVSDGEGGTVAGQLTYLFGFAEGDFNVTDVFGVLPSARIGINKSVGAGGGLKLRIGSAQNSHFLAGFEYSSAIGGDISMELHHFITEGTQFWVKSGLENLPAGQSWAGKVQVGGEHRLNRQLWLKAAVGVGGRRSTEEAGRGFNGMLGLSYNFMTGGR